MNQQLLDTLTAKAKEIMDQDKMYHDFAHIKNVLTYAKYLVEILGGDEEVIYTAALFHDIARDVDNHEAEGAKQLRDILKNIESFPQNKIDEICTAVEHHEKGQTTHNEKIIADADKIDAFNELGIGRGFMMMSHKGFKLKNGIDTYLGLLDTWFTSLNFDESREYVVTDYATSKHFLQKMQEMY